MSAPGWSAVATDSEGQRVLVGKRVAFFGRVFWLLSLAFYLRSLLTAARAVQGSPPLTHPALLFHFAAVSVGLGQSAKGPDRSPLR